MGRALGVLRIPLEGKSKTKLNGANIVIANFLITATLVAPQRISGAPTAGFRDQIYVFANQNTKSVGVTNTASQT